MIRIFTQHKAGGSWSRSMLPYVLAACFLAFFSFNPWVFAQNNGQWQEMAPPMSKEEIESAINALQAPMDIEKISLIQNAIGKLGTNERQHLQESLNQRLKDLYAVNIPRSAAPVAIEQEEHTVIEIPSALPEELKKQIDSLQLGQQSTADEVRERDEIVRAIANIPDPNLRYELLDYLQKKESSR